MDEISLKTKAKQSRLLILDMIYRAKTTHIGTAFSCTDIITALYFGGIMRVNPKLPSWPERDRFLLSKGHGCAALYAALGLKGFFPLSDLEKFTMEGSHISGHVTLNAFPGVEASGGSEGHGLGIAIGMALSARLDNKDFQVFVITGDGECQEGSIWEGIMFAGQHKLSNLTLIVDNNKLQIMGETKKIVDPEPFIDKFQAFRWNPIYVNGHNLEALVMALQQPTDKPKAIIADTIKGKGVSFMEGNYLWHGQCPNEEEYLRARSEIENAD